MAHSTQVVNGKYTSFDDHDLLVLLHLLIKKATSFSLNLESKQIVDNWRHMCQGYGPGCIDLQLEKQAANESQNAFVLKLLDLISDDLKEKDFYSSRVLLADWLTPGVGFIGDYPVHPLREAIEEIQRLCRTRLG